MRKNQIGTGSILEISDFTLTNLPMRTLHAIQKILKRHIKL